MSRKTKIYLVLALLVGAVLSALAFWIRSAVTTSRADRFFDLGWLHSASGEEVEEEGAWFRTLSPRQQRASAHRALTRSDGERGGANHHDAFFVLAEHGNEESIPYLLDWLKARGDLQEGHGIICIRGHCVDALEKITGRKLGYNYSDWKDWDKRSDR